jgi:diguanylate cyclase (GGDEF)-like protein
MEAHEIEVDHAGARDRRTVSLGVATYPLHGQTVARLIDAADRAMYEAKRRGKNTVVVAR